MPKKLKPFWSYVEKTDNCWLWNGAHTGNGYGAYSTSYAHRIAWSERNGDISKGCDLHHTCGNKLCVNPDHLREVNRSAHLTIHSMEKTRCRNGHLRTGENTYFHNGTRHCKECARKYKRRTK